MGMYDRQLLGYNTKLLSISGKLLRLFATGLYTFEEVNTMILTQNYIPVATAAELDALRTTTSQTMGAGSPWEGTYTTGLDKKYVQVENLDLSAYQSGEGWNPISAFVGTYDGNELVISELLINTTAASTGVGLFGSSTSAVNKTLKNIRLGGNITAINALSTGLLAGVLADGVSSVVNCHAIGNVTGGNRTGGLIGQSGGGGIIGTEITNSEFSGTVTGLASVGGLLGTAYNATTISNIYCNATVNGNNDTGGIVGNIRVSCQLSDSVFTGLEVNGNRYVGGAIGRIESSGSNITNTNSTTNISGVGDIGGFVGYTLGVNTFDNCHYSGDITNTSTYTGGFVGFITAGGIIRNSTASGSATSSSIEVGGFGGRVQSNGTLIEKCSSSVNVSSSSTSSTVSCAGFVGVLVTGNATIKNSFATGSATLTSTGSRVAGFAGSTGINIIENCYSIGAVSGNVPGGFLAFNQGTVTNCYYDSQTSGMSDTGKGNPRTTAQMKEGTADSFILPAGGIDGDNLAANAIYTAWSNDIWEFTPDNEYPTLK